MPEWLEKIGANEVAGLLDDVLKVYVLNRELLDKQITAEEFARLYDEFKEFENIDDSFQQLDADTMHRLAKNAVDNINQFAIIK